MQSTKQAEIKCNTLIYKLFAQIAFQARELIQECTTNPAWVLCLIRGAPLEVEMYSHLQNPIANGLISGNGRKNSSESRSSWIRLWRSELRVIKQIKGIGLECQPSPFSKGKFEILLDRKI
jgi:hypothetical protein